MTSRQNRTKSQPNVIQNAIDSQAAGGNSTRTVKTKVVYKTSKEDYDMNDKRSAYEQAYSKPKTPQKALETEKLTLADIGMMRNTPSAKSSMRKKEVVFENGNKLQRVIQSQDSTGNVMAETIQTINLPNLKAEENTASDFATKQRMYESQTMKQAMIKEFGGDPHVNINDEAEYYEAVKRLDYCGRCWASQKKYYSNPFKVNHKGPGLSLYQRDYVKHPLGDQGPVLKNDFYSTWQNNAPVDYGTTMKTDFKNWNQGPPKRETMDFRPATTGIPMAGTSNYRTNYVNWGPNEIAHEKAPQKKTVITELPFMSTTTYGANFCKPDPTSQLKPVNRDLWKKNSKSPISTGIPFLGETTHSATYKPFRVNKLANSQSSEGYIPTQALPEHLKSLYARDFTSPVHWKCPAIIFMENNPHPRYRHLSP